MGLSFWGVVSIKKIEVPESFFPFSGKQGIFYTPRKKSMTRKKKCQGPPGAMLLFYDYVSG